MCTEAKFTDTLESVDELAKRERGREGETEIVYMLSRFSLVQQRIGITAIVRERTREHV